MRAETGLLAGGAGLLAAVLHFAGALKSVPPVAALPVDLTAAAAVLLLPCLPLLALDRRWRLDRALALPLASAALLLLWLVLAGSWSASRVVLAEKLPQVVLLGPPMLVAGLLVGADAPARRRFCATVVAIGLVVGAAVAWGLATDQVVLGGEVGADPARIRVQYQLAGLAIACAAGLAAVRLVEVRGAARLAWALTVLALAAAVLLPGGRAALLGLGLAVAGAPALLLWLQGRRLAALLWTAGVAVLGLGGLFALRATAPVWADELRTLERLFGDPATEIPARLILWGEALRWGGLAAPFGLGTGGFNLAAGVGDDRSLHPHNHALEMLAEAGLPGLLLWLLAFGGGAGLALARAGRVAPGRAARIAALTLPVALTAMVSTDLGNRMAWFALGLLLSLGLEAERRNV
ncbi:MAG: O-antigen ligase family protein [Acetobacteraceae bacterium]|nr:O-antigen ligase family protein [Acetobacteraceae bacterium]